MPSDKALKCTSPQFYIQCKKCWCALGEQYDRDAMPEHRFVSAASASIAWNTRPTEHLEVLVGVRDALNKAIQMFPSKGVLFANAVSVNRECQDALTALNRIIEGEPK